MGGGAPSAPELPDPQPLPPPPPTPPAPPPLVEPEMPTPPPVTVAQGEDDATKIKKRRTKRETLQQQSSGTNALRIPLNTGSKASSKGSLNIPK